MGVNGGIENQSGKRSFSVMVIFGHFQKRVWSFRAIVNINIIYIIL